jgi:hypothetical protein
MPRPTITCGIFAPEIVSALARSPEPGSKVTGTILRLNRKTVSLVGSDGIHWRVAPALLSLVETQDVEAEVVPMKPTPTPAPNTANPGLRTLPLFEPLEESQDWPKNAPCHCGSGKKYKRCCLLKAAAGNRSY